MEEQKNKSKEVKMEPQVNTKVDNDASLSYEQLRDMADKLFNENKWLRQQNHQMNQALIGFERLDYLLRVINTANSCKDYSFNADFIQKCIDEVQIAMTPVQRENATEDNKEE